MLYDRWREIAREHRHQTALIDSSSGQQWTFQELDRASEPDQLIQPEPAFPSGLDANFVVTVLRAWRTQRVVCPLERDQSPIAFPPPPAGCVHVKATSATTGVPQLIAFTAGQLGADADQIVATMGLRPDWPNLGAISLAHSYGFSNLVLPLLLHGIPLVLTSSSLPESIRRAANRVPDITLPAVPALWGAWLEGNAIPKNVRLAISAGAPLPLALERQAFDQCGLKIHNFYGASECGGIAYDATETPREDPRCAGSALRNVKLSVDEEGCLCVQSPAVGLTYWPEPAITLAQGRFRTADLAQLEEGKVCLYGRQSDQINVAGRKVSPETIERALAACPGVRQCLVFGAPSPDRDRTEMIVACVVPRGTATGDSLKQQLLQTLPAWQLPRAWWFLPTLQANDRGKLPRAHWRQAYLARLDR